MAEGGAERALKLGIVSAESNRSEPEATGSGDVCRRIAIWCRVLAIGICVVLCVYSEYEFS